MQPRGLVEKIGSQECEPSHYLQIRVCFVAAAALFFLGTAQCGRKTAPMAPELVRPMPVGGLTAEVTDEGVLLSWPRPKTYVDGSKMDDLAGFKLFRAEIKPGENLPAYHEIAIVPVVDREKFRKAKRFHYLDKTPPRPAVYVYRVLAFSLDHYYSEPATSRRVELKVSPQN